MLRHADERDDSRHIASLSAVCSDKSEVGSGPDVNAALSKRREVFGNRPWVFGVDLTPYTGQRAIQ